MVTNQNQTTTDVPVLDAPDTHHINAAEGWLTLGDVQEAHTELSHLSLQARFHPRVLLARWEICARQEFWGVAYAIAQGLVVLVPGDPRGWINRSVSLHAMGRTAEAWQQLIPAASRFPSQPVIAYELARYSCQLGRLDEALQWLNKATHSEAGGPLKWKALTDPDLKALWKYLTKD